MIWELAGDYAWDEAAGQYQQGHTMIDLLHQRFSGTSPYGATKATGAAPTEALDVDISYEGFALGDNNYPINPSVRFTNNGSTAIPGGAKISFQYGTSAPGDMSGQGGWGTRVVARGHIGDNIGVSTGVSTRSR